MAISLPVVLVVLDIYPLKRLPGDPRKWFSRETRQVWLEKIPYFALAAVFGAIGYVFQAKAGALGSYQVFGLASRLTQIIFAVFFYIQKTLIPFDLSPLYKLPAEFSLLNWQSLFAGSVIAAITAATIALRLRWPAGLMIWISYLAMISPVSGIVKLGVQAAADRYTYLPCLGFAMLAGAGFRACRQAAGKRFRNICTVLACSIISCLAFLTVRQVGIWRDSETLWRHALDITPDSADAHTYLGVDRDAQGKTDEAAMHYREALKNDPNYAQAHNNLGFILATQGETGEAAMHYREALRITPDYTQAHNNLGLILAAQGKTDEAAMHYNEALRINPDFLEAHNNLGIIMTVQGRLDEAVKHYREILRINPNLAAAHFNLGVVLTAQGKTGEAAGHYKEASRINPSLRAPAPRKQEK